MKELTNKGLLPRACETLRSRRWHIFDCPQWSMVRWLSHPHERPGLPSEPENRCLPSGTGVCRAMDQVSHTCETWLSETQRPSPERSLLGKVLSVVIAVIAPLDVAHPIGPNRRVME
jgi:hypothetical protein